jgi:hypothetical protein
MGRRPRCVYVWNEDEGRHERVRVLTKQRLRAHERLQRLRQRPGNIAATVRVVSGLAAEGRRIERAAGSALHPAALVAVARIIKTLAPLLIRGEALEQAEGEARACGRAAPPDVSLRVVEQSIRIFWPGRRGPTAKAKLPDHVGEPVALHVRVALRRGAKRDDLLRAARLLGRGKGRPRALEAEAKPLVAALVEGLRAHPALGRLSMRPRTPLAEALEQAAELLGVGPTAVRDLIFRK